MRSINKTEDIEGAQGGSLKRGTQSLRQTNPLDPAYQWLGHTELVDPGSAYSRPKNDIRGSKGFSIQQNTAIESLKKTGALEVIPEKADLEVNKLYQASRQSEAGDEQLKKTVSLKQSFHGSVMGANET